MTDLSKLTVNQRAAIDGLKNGGSVGATSPSPQNTKDSNTIVLTVFVTYTGGATFEIAIPKADLHERLKDGESLQDIADELIYDTDYSNETDRDESDQDITIHSVEVETT